MAIHGAGFAHSIWGIVLKMAKDTYQGPLA